MASSQQYTLGLVVKMMDRGATTGIKDLRREIKGLDADARRLSSTFGKLSSTLGRTAFKSAASGADRLSDRLSNMERTARRTFSVLDRGFSKVGRGGGGGGGRYFGSGGGSERFFDGASQVGDVWRRNAGSLQIYTDAAVRLIRAQEGFKTLNLSPTENTQAFEAVKRTVNDIKGVSLADTTENLTDLYGALGKLGPAIEALPTASKYQRSMRTLFGDKMSADQINEQVRAAYKFIELTGAAMRGRGEMDKMLDTIVRIQSSTGGRVTPQEILMMGRRGNPAIQGLSTQGLTNISTLIEEMGAEGTGTSMMSLYQSLVGGQMPQYSARAFQKLGLIDPSKVEYGRAQKLKRVLPGGNLLGPLMQEDLLKAADLLMERLKASGVDTSDDKAVQSRLSVLFPNRNAFRMMNFLTTQRGQITKEAERTNQAKGAEALNQQAVDSPLAKIEQFNAAMENFRANVGLPLLQVANDLGAKLIPIGEFFAKHPDVIKYGAAALVAYKSLKSIAETGAALRQSGMIDYFSRSTGEINKASRAAGGLSSRLGALPASLKIGVALVAVGFTTEKILELMEANKDLKEANAGANTAAAGQATAYERARGIYQQKGQGTAQAKNEAIATLASVNRDRQLEYAADPSRQGMWDRFAKMGTNPFNTWTSDDIRSPVEKGRDVFREQARSLKFPEVMAAFRSELDKLKLPEISRTPIEKMLREAFPDSYKQVTGELGLELSKILPPTKSIGEQFNELLTPSGKLPGSLALAVNAVDSFAFRVNTLNLDTPVARPSIFSGPSVAPIAPFGRTPFDGSGFQKTSEVLQVAPAPASRASSGERPINVTSSPTININGYNSAEFGQELVKHTDEIARSIAMRIRRERELKG